MPIAVNSGTLIQFGVLCIFLSTEPLSSTKAQKVVIEAGVEESVGQMAMV